MELPGNHQSQCYHTWRKQQNSEECLSVWGEVLTMRVKQEFVDISNLPAPRSSQVGGTGAGTLSTSENHCL